MQSKNLFRVQKQSKATKDLQKKSKRNYTPKKKQEKLFIEEVKLKEEIGNPFFNLLNQKRPRSDKAEKPPKSKDKKNPKKAQKGKKAPKKKETTTQKPTEQIKVDPSINIMNNSVIDLCDTTINENLNGDCDDEITNMEIDEFATSSISPINLLDKTIITPKKRGRPKKVQTEDKSPATAKSQTQSAYKKRNFSKTEKKATTKDSSTKKQQPKQTQKQTQDKKQNKTQSQSKVRNNSLTERPNLLKQAETTEINSIKRSYNCIKVEFDKESQISFSRKSKAKILNYREKLETPPSRNTTLTEQSSENSLEISIKKNKNSKNIDNENRLVIQKEEEDSDEENQSAPGSFEYDVPRNVKEFRYSEAKDVFAVLRWKRRYDGSIPRKSIYPVQTVREFCPNLLINFLMKRVTDETSFLN